MRKKHEYIEGFRITCDGDGVVIEATDYHAQPLRLDRAALAELGLRLEPLPGLAGDSKRETIDKEPKP